MKRHATALRAFTHADDSFPGKRVFLNMDGGQFEDWSNAGLVREATDAEVARAKGEPIDKPAAKSRREKKPAGATRPAAATPEVVQPITVPTEVSA